MFSEEREHNVLCACIATKISNKNKLKSVLPHREHMNTFDPNRAMCLSSMPHRKRENYTIPTFLLNAL